MILIHEGFDYGGLNRGGADLDARELEAGAMFFEGCCFGKQVVSDGGNNRTDCGVMLRSQAPEIGFGVFRGDNDGTAGKQSGVGKSGGVDVV